jgi:hypothetical protein
MVQNLSTTDGSELSGDGQGESSEFWRERNMGLAVLLTSALSMVGSAYIVGSIHQSYGAIAQPSTHYKRGASAAARAAALARRTGE